MGWSLYDFDPSAVVKTGVGCQASVPELMMGNPSMVFWTLHCGMEKVRISRVVLLAARFGEGVDVVLAVEAAGDEVVAHLTQLGSGFGFGSRGRDKR
jgi:hypothetical protein